MRVNYLTIQCKKKERAALMHAIKTISYAIKTNYEPRGRAFESLRAHQ